jgi:hypothetical protein
LFVAVEPKGGRRTVRATDHRAKTDFVAFVQHLLEQVYATAQRVHLVMDNLNTHFRKCFGEVLGIQEAQALLDRVEFHYTPKHAGWLNMAEIEIGILDRQCLDRRSRIRPRSPPRSTPGKHAAIPSTGALIGRSLGRMQIISWRGTMFHN